jgi:SAM-dependent methyltransferase
MSDHHESTENEAQPAPRDRWDRVFTTRSEHERSWTEHEPTPSLDRIAALALSPADPIVDIGGGASRLVDHLLRAGHQDITVVDISRAALCQARSRIGNVTAVQWVEADVTRWAPDRQYAVWHDRAACHFLVDADDQSRYAQVASDHVRAGGHVIIGTFAPTGPDMCSGLPVRRWSADELAARFAPAFDLVSSDELRHQTPTGAVQPFTWVVLRRRSP